MKYERVESIHFSIDSHTTVLDLVFCTNENTLFPATYTSFRSERRPNSSKQQGHSRKPTKSEADTLSEKCAFTTQHTIRAFTKFSTPFDFASDA